MRAFTTTSSVILTTLAAVHLASADDLQHKDIPTACTTICDPLVNLTNICDINSHAGGSGHTRRSLMFNSRDDHGDDDDEHGSDAGGHVDTDADDAAERDCICRNTSFDVPKVAALCAACLTQNVPANGDRDGVEDMNDIMSECSFLSTTYVPEATSAVAGVTVSATKPVAGAATSTGPGGAGTTGTGSPTSNQTPGGSSGALVKVPGYVVGLVGVVAVAFAWC
ncbi:hypothetical protein V8F20_006617 [Naviculisporaceae sp. PSN 640]